jgi:hypothetical protein
MRVSQGEKGLKDFYNLYEGELTYNEFAKILKKVNKVIAVEILKGISIKFPMRLGTFCIKKVKNNYKHLKFNYHVYNTTGVKTYHLNEHSKEFHGKWFWERILCNIIGHKRYCFIPSRGNKRALAKVMKTEGGYKLYTQ